MKTWKGKIGAIWIDSMRLHLDVGQRTTVVPGSDEVLFLRVIGSTKFPDSSEVHIISDTTEGIELQPSSLCNTELGPTNPEGGKSDLSDW